MVVQFGWNHIFPGRQATGLTVRYNTETEKLVSVRRADGSLLETRIEWEDVQESIDQNIEMSGSFEAFWAEYCAAEGSLVVQA